MLQVNPHCVPSQLAAPLVGTGQAMHDVVPQFAMLPFETHAPLHGCRPLLQVNPHDVPLQVETAFVGGEQAVHDVEPQLLMLVLATQAVPHR